MGLPVDIVITPHCDMHVAMAGTPQLQIRVFQRWYKQDAAMPNSDDMRRYELRDVTATCTYTFFAPYEAVGSRMTRFVNIDNTGRVTPVGPGINFIEIVHADAFGRFFSMIVRIQVHSQVLGWWFGIPSLTVAKDDICAHTQVSIHALFSDDAKKTDLVGDITGHGYVNLASSDNTVFEPDASRSGRMWGKTAGTATLTGTFLGNTKTMPVKVIDYSQPRTILDPVQYVKPPAEAHNMLFLPEGFRDTADDKEKFNDIVADFVEQLFEKPRHSPFNILRGSFNVFKAWMPSNQHAITSACAFTDEDDSKLSKGKHIPHNERVSGATAYSPEELIRIVGLPLRNETRTAAELKTLWGTQSLTNFNAAKVDDELVSVWKKQRSLGISEARDTLFGMTYGRRYADRSSRGSITPLMAAPNADTPSANLTAFINRLYQWFYAGPTRLIIPDPRRHAPEVLRGNEDPENIIMQFVAGLNYIYDSSLNIGKEWVPDVNGTTFKRSVGLIGVIVNDNIHGGGNIIASTMTTTSIESETELSFAYVNSATEKILRRNPPMNFSDDTDTITDIISHEFGHSFNLGDEYESFSGDDATGEDKYDNIAAFANISLTGLNRLIDPDKVKWLEMLRIDLSAKLMEDSTTDGGNLKVKIDPQYAGKWIEAKAKNKPVDIRAPQITNKGKQLPLLFGDAHYLVRLQIMNVDTTNGFIFLGGPELPSPPLPVFPKGSFIFVPVRDSNGDLRYVVEKKVMDFLKNNTTNKNLPLNKDVDNVNPKNGTEIKDEPKSIPDFDPPCKEYKTIGVYEGAHYHAGLAYRPAGNCKMRVLDGSVEFCHVCKYLIVNRVDPEVHDVLDHNYYPNAKKT